MSSSELASICATDQGCIQSRLLRVDASQRKLDTIQSVQERAFALQNENKTEIDQQQSSLENLRVLQDENTKRLEECNAHLGDQQGLLDVVMKSGREQERTIQALGQRCTWQKVAGCFAQFREYALPVMIPGSIGALTLGIIVQTGGAVALGGIAGGCLGGAAYYAYKKVKACCWQVPLAI